MCAESDTLIEIAVCTPGIFSWSGAMGSGPVKGFNSPEVEIDDVHDLRTANQ